MGIVGQAGKQPAETDLYDINLADDLAATDAPAAAHAFVMVHRQAGPVVAVTSARTASTPLARYLLSGGAALTLAGMAPGDRVYVANKNPVAAVEIDSVDLVDGAPAHTLAALHGVALVKTAAGWEIEATARVIVDAANKRLRIWLAGGADKLTYKIEATTTSAEGRVLQDEILVKVKET